MIQHVKSKYQRSARADALVVREVGKQYEVDLLTAVHMIAHVW